MNLSDMIIRCEEFRTKLDAPTRDFTLLDVREPEEYAENRIEGCILIPLGELMQRAERELDARNEIIVYCAHGVRSLHAVRGLKSLGFDNCRSLSGGIAEFLGIP